MLFAQHSTAQHGTAQHGTAQHSTAQLIVCKDWVSFGFYYLFCLVAV